MRDPGGKYVKEENEVSSVRRTQRSLGIQEWNSELWTRQLERPCWSWWKHCQMCVGLTEVG